MDIENQPSSASPQQAPLPWLADAAIKGAVKLRPQGLLPVSMLIGADDLLMLLFVEPRHWHSPGWVVFWLIVKLLDFWIVWHLWKGRNWARLLILIGAAIGLFSVTLLHKETHLHQAYTLASILLSVYMLYWLCRKPVIRFFKAPGNGISEPLPGM